MAELLLVEHRPEAAILLTRPQPASLLDTAGYKVGSDGIRSGTCGGKTVKFSISLETTVKQLRQDEQAAIQANLKAIGIDVKTVATPAGTFFGSYSEGATMPLGKFDMAIFTTGLLSGSGCRRHLALLGSTE